MEAAKMRGGGRDPSLRHQPPLVLGTPSNPAPKDHRTAMARARNLFLRVVGKGSSLPMAVTRFTLAVLPLALLLSLVTSMQLRGSGQTLLTSLGLGDFTDQLAMLGLGSSPRATQLPVPVPASVPVPSSRSGFQGSAVTPQALAEPGNEDDEAVPALAASFRVQACSDESGNDLLLTQSELGYARNLKHRQRRMGNSLTPPFQMPWNQFRQRMLVPLYSCSVPLRLGKWGEGGAWVCMASCRMRQFAADTAERISAGGPAVVKGPGQGPVVVSVSFKAGTTFERDAAALLGTRAHVFNPFLNAQQKEAMAARPYVTFHDAGVVTAAGKPEGRWLTVQGLLEAVGSPSADVLRLDCEGCELQVVSQLTKGLEEHRAQPLFGQVMMEVHHLSRPRMTMSLLMQMEALGYRLFSAEPDAYSGERFHLAWVHDSLVQPQGLKPSFGPKAMCTKSEALKESLAMAEAAFSVHLAKRDASIGAVPGQPFPHISRKAFADSMLIPTYACPYEERWGLWGEGGKWVCMGFCGSSTSASSGDSGPGVEGAQGPWAGPMRSPPVVVSVGSRGDSSFEADANANTGAIPHTFDPFLAPALDKAMKERVPYLQFHSIGLTGEPNLAEARTNTPRVQWASLKELLTVVGSDYVDVFKIDCEGCEWGVVEEMGASFTRERPAFGQIQMEVHHLNDIGQLSKLFTVLERLGYRLFHAEPNAYCVECYEIALIHESLVGGGAPSQPLAAEVSQAAGALVGSGESAVDALQAVQGAPGTRVAAQVKRQGSFLTCSAEDAGAVEGAQAQAEASFGSNLQHRRRRMQASLVPPYNIALGPFKARMLVPLYSCPHKERLGPWGEGGRWVCTGFCGLRNAARAQPLLASVGWSWGGMKFEEDAASLLSARVHVFSPSIHGEQQRAVERGMPGFSFHNLDVGEPGSLAKMLDALQDSAGPYGDAAAAAEAGATLSGPFVDILKVDCEGCEVGLVRELSSRTVRSRPVFGQIVMEVHSMFQARRTTHLMRMLEQLGYRLFHAEPDTAHEANFELAFIHDSLVRPPLGAASPALPPRAFPLALSGRALGAALREAEEGFQRNLAKRARARALVAGGTADMKTSDFIALMMQPTYACVSEWRMGLWGEGGKWVCLGYVPRDAAATPTVVSIGSRGDPSFEQDAHRALGSTADTFDPFIGPHAQRLMRNLTFVRFHSAGLTGESELGASRAAHPSVQWATVADMLGIVRHPGHVDIFKIDCEGCELSVVEEMKARHKREEPHFGQIQMEIHHVGFNTTVMVHVLETLEGLGYRLFHAELNAYCGRCYEIALIHESLVKPPEAIA